ncbi:hypothetical protein AB1Y20_001446 [Prymnesium parvum]|uniref:Uncharacterized protein n=1 Tax=Prymnesium parvum TaxID=97485 RepID=A0AB34KDP9_PRYPA
MDRLSPLLITLTWRKLYLSRCCPACLNERGDFGVRRSKHDAPMCFLCAACCKQPRVVLKLQQQRATLDVTGLSGRPLYTEKTNRFIGEVHTAAKKAGLG